MKQIKNINLEIVESDVVQTKIDKSCAQLVRSINSEAEHRHLTNGIIAYEIIAMFSDIEISDASSRLEAKLDEELISHGVSPETINELTSKSADKSGSNEKIKFVLPEHIIEDLDYFKAEQIESLIYEYMENPFNSRDDRTRFKQVLIDCLEAEKDYTEVSMSSKYTALFEEHEELQDIVSENNWYDSLTPSEIIDRAGEVTKKDKKARLDVINAVIDKLEDQFVEHYSSANNFYNTFDIGFEDGVPFDDIDGLINKMFDPSRPTVNKYKKELDIDIEQMKKNVLTEVDTEKIVIEAGLYCVSNNKRHTVLNNNSMIDMFIKSYLSDNTVEFEFDGTEYRAFTEDDENTSGLKIEEL